MNATTTNRGVSRAAIYRDAARLLEEKRGITWFSCHAIYQAKHGMLPDLFVPENTPEVVAYGDIFRPDQDELDAHCGLWFDCLRDAEEQENHRIVMLCFMAAMVEAGDA